VWLIRDDVSRVLTLVNSDGLQWSASLQGGCRAEGNPLSVLRYCFTLLFVRWMNRDVAPFIHVPPPILTLGARWR
jgi:hypothetical protein